jgi:hypothetical protein
VFVYVSYDTLPSVKHSVSPTNVRRWKYNTDEKKNQKNHLAYHIQDDKTLA